MNTERIAVSENDPHVAALDVSKAPTVELHTMFRTVMAEAIQEAANAALAGDVPVGALVLDGCGKIIGRGHNRREQGHDPLAHAEIEAMCEAAVARGNWNLSDCTLVVTLEPCPMCAGACLQTHVGRIVFGAWDAKLGACGSVWDIPRDPHIGHTPEVYGGIRETDCAQLLTTFFTTRR